MIRLTLRLALLLAILCQARPAGAQTAFYKTVDNASTTTTGYTAASGSIALATGTGSKFGSTFPVAFSTFLANGTAQGVYACTGRTGDTLTGLTLLSGTDASLPSGSLVSVRWTAEHASQITAAINSLETAGFLLPAGNGSSLTGLTQSQISGLTSALSAKAPLASPALTGTPTAPTATVGTNTTQVASTAFVLANAGAANPNTTYVLRFPGPPAQSHVDCGSGFWSAAGGTATGICLWDAIFKPTGTANGYFVADGYGGAHMLLWGLDGTPGAVTGNINTSAGNSTFGGNYLVGRGEWCHHAVGTASFVGSFGNVFTYVNGVPDGVCQLAGTRQTGGPTGNLYIGGSDHINLAMDAAYVRGFDFGNNQFSGAPMVPFFPPRYAPVTGSPNLLIKFNNPGNLVDLSPTGTINGSSVYATHSGALGDSLPGGAIQDGTPLGLAYQGANAPFWVADSNSPFERPLGVGSFTTGETILAPRGPPGGCKIYDSFGRRNQTYFTDVTPSLGSTEAGSLGALTWSQGYTNTAPTSGGAMPSAVGILQSQACLLGIQLGSAWVETGSATQDVRVHGPTVSNFSPGCTGLTLRQQDKDNFIAVFYQNTSWADYTAGGSLYVFPVTAGVVGSYSFYSVAGNQVGWVRATASGTTITLYASPDGTTWTNLGNQTVSSFSTATKAGMTFGTSVAGPIGVSRVREFVCF